jgi:hypothetical protein
MAVIKYQINGKADTKPIKNTEAAAEGMFKKISAIDNKLKAFVGVKVFSEVSKAINNSLKEYDAFQNSLNEETNFTKELKNLNTVIAGTLGTVRDEVLDSFSGIFSENNDFLSTFQEVIPKVGAHLMASMKVVETIVKNVRNNFDTIKDPKTWDNFFSHANKLGEAFCTFFGNMLKDTFTWVLGFFEWGFQNMNLANLIWAPAKFVFGKIVDFFEGLGSEIAPWVKDLLNDTSGFETAVGSFRGFNLSADSVNALNDFNKELGATFAAAGTALAGTDVNTLFAQSYNENLTKLEITIKDMIEAANGNTEEIKNLLNVYRNEKTNAVKDALSSSSSSFKDASGRINTILGDSNNAASQKIRETMSDLNIQFETTASEIKRLSEAMKAADTVEEIDNIFSSIEANINKMDGLTKNMDGMQGAAKNARDGFDLVEGALSSLGQAGQVIGMIMSSNPIGLIIILISKLVRVFSNISGPFAAFMNIFDVFFDVVEEICAVLEPVFSAVLTPILDIVRQLAMVFGMVLNVVAPLLGIFGLLNNMLKILQPILYGIAWIFAALADGIGSLWNMIANVLNKIPFVHVDTVDTNNRDRLKDIWNAEQNYDQYQNSNNSTSSSVAGDMYININVDRSCIVGEPRDVALWMRDVLRQAEASGY